MPELRQACAGEGQEFRVGARIAAARVARRSGLRPTAHKTQLLQVCRKLARKALIARVPNGQSRCVMDSPTTEEDALRGLAAFLPRFKAAGFQFGHWTQPTSGEQGVIVMPYFDLSDEASAFVQAAYNLGWVRGDIDWHSWGQTPEAQNLQNDPALLAQATREQLASLLTLCIRQDRFVEGTLMSAYESGLLVRILERVATLAEKP